MRYLVIYDQGYEGYCLHDFDTRMEADAYLASQLNTSWGDPKDYELYEYTQTFDVVVAVEQHNLKMKELKEQALAKLNDEEKIALGLAKA